MKTLDRDACVTNGLLIGLLVPGIAQIIARKQLEGYIWLVVVIAAWMHFGAWALVIHFASASRCAHIMAKSYDILMSADPSSP